MMFQPFVVTVAEVLVASLSRSNEVRILQTRGLLRVAQIFRVLAEPASCSLRHCGQDLLERVPLLRWLGRKTLEPVAPERRLLPLVLVLLSGL